MTTLLRAVVVLCLVLAGAVPAFAATLTVTNTNDSGPGSLRQAMLEVNAGDRIEFSIGSGPQRIQPLSALPLRGICFTIDGETQPGFAGRPMIELDGSFISGFATDPIGLHMCGLVQGLIVNNFRGTGIRAYSSFNSHTTIRRCYIGTNADGTAARPNVVGISVSGASRVGGESPGDGNLIAGNGTGVEISPSGGDVYVLSNTFGSDVARTRTLTTGTHIRVSGSPRLGGVSIIGNYFFGGQSGVSSFAADWVTVFGNQFGITPAGVLLPVGSAVTLSNSNNQTVRGNTIVGSNFVAVGVYGNSLRNTITQNAIKGNAFGIDLGGDGRTFNDPFDDDIGANNFVNYPVINSASSVNGTVTIGGTLDAAPNRTYTIELFRSAACSSSGVGNGETFLESFSVTTGGSGSASFTRTIAANIPAGHVITATATTALEGTSEFSPCRAVEGQGVFSFNQSFPTSTTEGAQVSLTVRRTLGAVGAATVNWAAAGGTATPGADYAPTSGVLSFADGETSKTFTIPTIDDTVYEGQESFTVTLTTSSAGTSIGNPSTASVTITDNDPPPTFVTTERIDVQEGDAGTKAITVAIGLSRPTGVPITVNYNTFGSFAASGVDFMPANGSLTFNPGETQKSITVTIIGDTAFEEDEWFEVAFFSPQLGSRWVAVVILNDDVAPTVSVEDATVVETDGSTTVQVRLTASTAVTGRIYYGVASGTATAGSDFTHGGFFVDFFNQKTRTIPITILGDDEAEPDETFTVELQATTFPIAIQRRTATVGILNDDTGVGPRDQMIAAGETGSFMIDIGQPRATPSIITLGSSDPQSVSVPASVTLPAGKSAVIFAAKALKAGAFANIVVKMPPELEGDVFTLRAYTYAKVDLVFEPKQLAMYVGQSVNVRVRLEPAATETVLVPLTANGGLEVPARISIAPGQTATFQVKATKTGPAAVRARLPRDYGNREVLLTADVRDTPATPTILRLSPPNGPAAGGTSVDLEGVSFTRDCTIRFGATPAKSVRFLTSTLLTAVTPPHDEGVVDVVLTCGELTSTFTAGFAFVDSAPQISHLEPSTGSTGGGTHVRIAGTDLRSSCWPFFAGTAATAAQLESPAAMLAVTPPHAAGSVDVMLRCTGGDALASEAFLYTAGDDPSAAIMTVAPLAAAPGEEVTISGTRFRPSDRITFGGTAATLVRTAPDKHVVVVPELPAGRIALNLTDSAGRLTTTGPIFAVLEATRPRITAVVPASAPAGAEVELQGEGFRPGYSFQIGGRLAAIVSSSYTRAVVRLSNELAPGRYDVHVINSASQLASIGPAVTVTGGGLAIHTISARCATTSGGEELTITGAGFEGSMLVMFGPRLAGTAMVVDGQTLAVTVPPGEAGPVQIRVTRADGATATLTGAFRYASPFDPGGCSGGLRGGRAVRH